MEGVQETKKQEQKAPAEQVSPDKQLIESAQKVFAAAYKRFKDSGELSEYSQTRVASLRAPKVKALQAIYKESFEKAVEQLGRDFYSTDDVIGFIRTVHNKVAHLPEKTFPNFTKIMQLFPSASK